MPADQTLLDCRALICVPHAPPNVSVDYNMSIVKARMGIVANAFDLQWFYNQVRNKGPWDYKSISDQYCDFGNFNFGATGAAMGIPTQILLRGAGWAQTQAGTSLKSFGDWYKDAPMAMIHMIKSTSRTGSRMQSARGSQSEKCNCSSSLVRKRLFKN